LLQGGNHGDLTKLLQMLLDRHQSGRPGAIIVGNQNMHDFSVENGESTTGTKPATGNRVGSS
jgi:hypothetical protein